MAGLVLGFAWPGGTATTNGNRLTYLDGNDPFYVNAGFPRLTTPQWVGDPEVEAVVILSIDDLRETAKHEAFLRPILDRLRQVDGRAPVSIMSLDVKAEDPQLQAWLREGVALEAHTLSHRHPILSEGNFAAGAETYHGSVALMHRIPGNKPVAFRLPYCDSMNAASPRFYAEIFNQTNSAGQFLSIDSSIALRFTTNDSALPRELALDGAGRDRFAKYLPGQTNALTRVNLAEFSTYVTDYPYPYVIGRLCWEFPMVMPSDWQAHNAHGSSNAVTMADWKATLDAVVIKQGVFTLVFHPHGWIGNHQIVELIDYAVTRYGKKVKFLTFREAQQRLNQNLLAGQPLRSAAGGDNGVRLVDLNNDRYLDVVIGNAHAQRTRLWHPAQRTWTETNGPAALTAGRFSIVHDDGAVSVLIRTETQAVAWTFRNGSWASDSNLLNGLNVDSRALLTQQGGRDTGMRFRDADNDGRSECIVGNPTQNAILGWDESERCWKPVTYALPANTAVVDSQGADAGLRWVDLNEDGYDDVIFSNLRHYALYMFVPEPDVNLGWKKGWTDMVVNEPRITAATNSGLSMPVPIPPFVRDGAHPNNGIWFKDWHLVIQNEDTAHLPGQVERSTYHQLLTADQPPPRPPQETLASIRVHPGLKVELVAQEPLTMDPVWFDWSADGRLWVVEMGDYPIGIDGKGKPGGIVRFLQDTNHDGRYDTSTVFLDQVNFPNGILPWRNGVIVSAAPEIFYAEDTNGDGRADVRRTLFTGFTEGNQQHRVNGFDYGLDNWIHAANGDSGGVVLSVLTGKKTDIRGRDVRFRPDTGGFETTAGQTQYGRHRDDWGNWFGNNNINWLWHYHVPEHYLVRNPHLAVKSMKHMLAQYPDAARLYPTSRFLQRFNWPDAVNLVTSASAAMPYRDDLFGPSFANSVFICEPVYQAIHREVLDADGVSFTSHRAVTETNFEFFTSTDNWCRPVFAKVGPDGALYIADMYRYVIEHPEWIPPAMQKRLDLRAGHDLGRIYRVYPEKATLRPPPRLDRLDTAGLVAALDHPSGWQRDTAQRLLLHRKDAKAMPLLQVLARTSTNPKARIHALSTLEGLEGLNADTLITGLRDSHPYVREHALRVSEHMLRRCGVTSPAPTELAQAILATADDAELRVRYQLAFTLGEWPDPRAGQTLARLARKDFAEPAMELAIMSSAVPHVGVMLESLFVDASQAIPPGTLLEQLVGLAIALRRDADLVKPVTHIVESRQGEYAAWQYAALGGVLDALDRRKLSLQEFRSRCTAELAALTRRFDPMFVQARALVSSPTNHANSPSTLLPAIRILGRGTGDKTADLACLKGLLTPQSQPEIQRAALATLRRVGGAKVGEMLLSGWRAYSPDLRREALNILFSRPEWLQELLAALEAGTIPPVQIDSAHQQTLLTHAQAAIRDRANKLFGATRTDRQEVLKAYQSVLELKGDPAQGMKFFAPNCGTCHQLKGEGTAIGADLGTVADKPVEYLVTAILDPNRAVEDRFVSYTVVTRSDQEFSGIITVETPNSITLRNATGQETILRTDIQELTSSALSLMPEGLEAAFKPQDLADLIAYIKSVAGQK